MAADRLLRVVGILADANDSGTPQLCQVATQLTSMSGAGIMLFADGRLQASVCSTDEVSSLIEEAQFTLGEGPCVDAHRLGRAIFEPELGTASSARWTAFSRRAFGAGARAVFGYPIRIGSVPLGALSLYRSRPGPLTDVQHADAVMIADIAARAILAAQAGARPGELGAGDGHDLQLWGVVHQAAGMVSVQLDVAVADALDQLRAHAFATDRFVLDVARDVVDRRLRLDAKR